MQKYKKKLFSYELAGFFGYFSPEMVKNMTNWWVMATYISTYYDQD